MGGRPARELVRDRRAAPICATSLAGVTREVEEKWTSVPQIKMGYPIVQVSIYDSVDNSHTLVKLPATSS